MDSICLRSVGANIPIAQLDDLAHNHNWQHRHFLDADALSRDFTPNAADCILVETPRSDEAAKPLICRIHKQSFCAPVIAADRTPSVARATAAFHAGACDYCELPFDSPSIGDRITRFVVQSVKSRGLWLARRDRLALLTPAEVQVLELLLSAHTTKAIAHRLSICTKTVESRRARLFDKLNVGGVTELFKLWLECSEATPPGMKRADGEVPSLASV